VRAGFRCRAIVLLGPQAFVLDLSANTCLSPADASAWMDSSGVGPRRNIMRCRRNKCGTCATTARTPRQRTLAA
jgi:hypothetical protein